MDSCPIEVSQRILALAVTPDGDGDGSALSSLRLVSRAFLALTAPFRFYTVSISGSESLDHLLEELEALASKNRRVCNLFFCDRPRHFATEDLDYPAEGCVELDDEEQDEWHLPAQADERDAKIMAPQLARLLELVAPTVVKLTCLVYNPYFTMVPATLARVHFPALTHLTYKPVVTLNGPRPTEGKECPETMDMPALRQLEVAVISGGRQELDLLRVFVDSCRCLDSVTLSDVDAAPATVIVVRHLLKDPSAPAQWPPRWSSDPPGPTIRAFSRAVPSVILAPVLEEDRYMGDIYNYGALEELLALESRDEKLKVEAMYEGRMSYDARKRQWLRRLSD
jgi:hypothetical protein